MSSKIFDCFMFNNEDLLLDIRFNILNRYVDYFVIVESKFMHSGKEKKFFFDIKRYPKFEKKIIYVLLEEIPSFAKGYFSLQCARSQNNEHIDEIFYNYSFLNKYNYA